MHLSFRVLFVSPKHNDFPHSVLLVLMLNIVFSPLLAFQAEQDGRVLKQASDAAQQLSPRRGPLPSHPPGELAICSPRARWVEAREVGSRGDPTATTNPHSQQVRKKVWELKNISETFRPKVMMRRWFLRSFF